MRRHVIESLTGVTAIDQQSLRESQGYGSMTVSTVGPGKNDTCSPSKLIIPRMFTAWACAVGGGGVDRSGCSLCRPGLLWELNTRSTVLGLVGFLGASSDMMSELLEGMSLCKEGIGLLRMIPRRPS